jgi:hypothetical protein
MLRAGFSPARRFAAAHRCEKRLFYDRPKGWPAATGQCRPGSAAGVVRTGQCRMAMDRPLERAPSANIIWGLGWLHVGRQASVLVQVRV